MPVKVTTEGFIERAISVHGKRYDYSEAVYVNKRTKLIVICSEHGSFQTTPEYHTSMKKKVGCPTCGFTIKHTTMDREEYFRDRAYAVHGSKYDYSDVYYVDSTTRVTIICPEHGSFTQTPVKHYRGRGCALCGAGQYNDMPTILYYVRVEKGDAVGWKIGITTKSVKERYRKENAVVTILDEIRFSHGKEAFKMEQAIINAFRGRLHKHGKSLLRTGYTELFEADVLGGSIPAL